MNNQFVEAECANCKNTLTLIRQHIGINSLSPITEHLNKYSAVLTCGIIERSIKKLIYDRVTRNGEECIKNYFEKNIMRKSINPNYENIIRELLKPFNRDWEYKFKEKMHQTHSQEQEHLESLVSIRNSIAHGGGSTPTIDSIIAYFDSSLKIINLLESIIMP